MSTIKIKTGITVFSAMLLVIVVIWVFNIANTNIQNNSPNYDSILANGWNYYKAHYLQKDGRIVDFASQYISTSEGQSYALLMAVEQNDQASFDKIYAWTKNNLEVRSDHLLSWRWGRLADGQWKVDKNSGDYNSATDGDEQAASALVQAYYKWHNDSYLNEALPIVKDVYAYDTYKNSETVYITGGSWANIQYTPDYLYINPSYLRIADFRKFAIIDKSDNWNGIIDSSYKVMDICTSDDSNVVKLTPNWCILDFNTLKPTYNKNGFSLEYGYDAFRTMYNLALDYKVTKDSRDIAYLKKTYPQLYKNYKLGKYDSRIDIQDGSGTESGSLAITTGMIANFSQTNKNESAKLYSNIIISSYNKNTGQLGKSYYDSNWAWFITYLLSDKTSNEA